MRIIFTYEHLNLLLILIGSLLIFYLLSIRSSQKRAIKFGNYKILEKISGGKIFEKNYLPLFLRIIAITLIVLSISNIAVVVDQLISNSDFVIALDTSSSMLTPDLLPNRLEAAKTAAINLVDKVPDGTKIGVVSFAGKAYVRIPVTDDKEKIKEVIRNITFDVPAGTSISDALITSSILLQNSTKKRTIILITDGKNNIGAPMNVAISYVNDWNVSINAIGLGSNYTIDYKTNITVPKENATIAEFPKLDTEYLINLTNQTGGKLFLPTNSTGLNEAFYKSILKPDVVKIELRNYFLIAAAVILILEWGLAATKYKTIP